MTNCDPKKLAKLLSMYADGMLDNLQQQELFALLDENADARDAYIEYMMLHATMLHRLGARGAFSPSIGMKADASEITPTIPSELSANRMEVGMVCDLSELAPELLWGITSPKDEPEKPMLGFLGECFNNSISFLSRNIVLVIVLLPLLAIFTVLWMSPALWETPSEGWTLAARVIKTVDCQWQEGAGTPGTGSFLVPGQRVNLEKGLTELEFSSGARVILQGPAELTITGENSSTLSYGQLTATVPKKAEGFSVKTPSMEVVDLGTEFGVAVNTADRADIHVFKGLVEMEADTKSGKQKKFRLKKNEAVEYSKKSGDIIHVPIDMKKFVRNLDHHAGVTANLLVTNASFESPDIRTVSEYQPKQGNTLFRPIYGWKMSDTNQATSRVAMYQISPYKSLVMGCDVKPGATDGRQVATISLGVKSSQLGTPRSNWMYQSLGKVASADVGKTLKLSVDAGPRSEYAGLPQGNGTVFAGFALYVTPEHSGTILGKPGSFHPEAKIEQLHKIEASVLVTEDMVGQEMFILLAASDNGSSQNIDQYHFDNVQLSSMEK